MQSVRAPPIPLFGLLLAFEGNVVAETLDNALVRALPEMGALVAPKPIVAAKEVSI